MNKKNECNLLNKIGSSETTRVDCLSNYNLPFTINTKLSKKKLNIKQAKLGDPHFSYWLAGLIDGDGYLGVSKKNYTCCEITVGEKELNLLSLVKKNLGGTITKRQNVKAYRWRLHNKKGMETLINHINGKLLLPSKKIQLEKVCTVLNIKVNIQNHFSKETYWLTGFYEAEGYFHLNTTTFQCNITLSQKTPELLEKIKQEFGGRVYYDISWKGQTSGACWYLYSASCKQSLLNWFKYFDEFPLKSWKNIDLVRFKRIVLFKERKYHLKTNKNDKVVCSKATKNKFRKRFLKLVSVFKVKDEE